VFRDRAGRTQWLCVCSKREFSSELDSCVLEGKEIGRVLAGCDFRSVICELYSRTDRSCRRVRILEEL
jgi:hypothetical protein